MFSAKPFNTVWPSIGSAPASIKKWVDDFYHLADDQSSDAPERFASLFAEDGEMNAMAGKLVGREAIAASRPHAWVLQKERRHEPLQVYTRNEDFSDLLVLGSLVAEFRNGIAVEVEFAANIVLSGDLENAPLCSLYRVWGDSAPWVAAMKKE